MEDDSDTSRSLAGTNGLPDRQWLGSLGVLVLSILLVTSLVAGFVALGTDEASAQAGFSSGDVDLEAFVSDNTFTPGQAAQLDLQIANDASIGDGSSPASTGTTTTARNVRVEVDEKRAPISVETGEQSIGSIGMEEPRNVPIEIEVPDHADPGEYEIEVELEYSQTRRVFDIGGIQGDRTRTVTRDIDIVIDDSARFELRDAGTEAQVGDSGLMTAEIENVGGETAEELTVELASTSQRVGFGESASETARVTSLEPGETAPIAYDVTFGDRASVRGYPLDATVTFEDSDGITNSDETTLDVTPRAEQTFAIENVESTLRVGEDGDLLGTVENTGSETANSVVVRYADDAATLVPVEDRVAVGALDPGESADFRLPIEVTREAEALPRALDLSVRYRNADNELRTFEDVDAFAEIEQRRDQFLVSFEDRELASGDSRLVDVEVTNNLDQPVTDIEAQLFADDPLDSDDDEGYVESLDPGESTTMTFELNADGSATAKTYPISFDFRYDDQRGNSQLSDTTRIAITVTEPDDGGLPLLPIGIVLIIVGAAGAYWYRRA